MALEMPDQTFDERAGQMFDQPAPPASWMNNSAAASSPAVAAALENPEKPEQDDATRYLNDPVLKPLREQQERLRDQSQGIKQQALRDIHSYRNDLPQPPQLEQTPPSPKQEIGKGAMEFMQVATLVGALGGLLARRGATTSLNAFAGAIKGFSEGNLEIYKAKSEEWKQAAEQVKEQNHTRLEQYDAILKNKKMGLDQKMEELKIVASMNGDEMAWNLADQRNYTAFTASLDKQRQLALNYEKSLHQMKNQDEGLKLRMQQYQDRQDEGNDIAEGIEAGKIPPVPASMGTYQVKNITEGKLAKDKFDLGKAQLKWAAAMKQVQAQNGAQQSRYYALSNTVEQNIDRVEQLSQQMQNSGITPLNHARLVTLINTAGNTPQGQLASRYLAAITDLKEPLANLANGGYAPTDAAWVQANALVNADYGVLQLKASLDEAKRAIGFRKNAMLANGGYPPGSDNPYSSAAPTQKPAAPAAPDSQGGGGRIKYDAQGNPVQ